MGMLTDWTDEHTKKFQKEIMTFGHDLKSTGLFTDEALIKLLEKHPSDQLDVCTMGASDHPLYPIVSVPVIFAIHPDKFCLILRRQVVFGSTCVRL